MAHLKQRKRGRSESSDTTSEDESSSTSSEASLSEGEDVDRGESSVSSSNDQSTQGDSSASSSEEDSEDVSSSATSGSGSLSQERSTRASRTKKGPKRSSGRMSLGKAVGGQRYYPEYSQRDKWGAAPLGESAHAKAVREQRLVSKTSWEVLANGSLIPRVAAVGSSSTSQRSTATVHIVGVEFVPTESKKRSDVEMLLLLSLKPPLVPILPGRVVFPPPPPAPSGGEGRLQGESSAPRLSQLTSSNAAGFSVYSWNSLHPGATNESNIAETELTEKRVHERYTKLVSALKNTKPVAAPPHRSIFPWSEALGRPVDGKKSNALTYLRSFPYSTKFMSPRFLVISLPSAGELQCFSLGSQAPPPREELGIPAESESSQVYESRFEFGEDVQPTAVEKLAHFGETGSTTNRDEVGHFAVGTSAHGVFLMKYTLSLGSRDGSCSSSSPTTVIAPLLNLMVPGFSRHFPIANLTSFQGPSGPEVPQGQHRYYPLYGKTWGPPRFCIWDLNNLSPPAEGECIHRFYTLTGNMLCPTPSGVLRVDAASGSIVAGDTQLLVLGSFHGPILSSAWLPTPFPRRSSTRKGKQVGGRPEAQRPPRYVRDFLLAVGADGFLYCLQRQGVLSLKLLVKEALVPPRLTPKETDDAGTEEKKERKTQKSSKARSSAEHVGLPTPPESICELFAATIAATPRQITNPASPVNGKIAMPTPQIDQHLLVVVVSNSNALQLLDFTVPL